VEKLQKKLTADPMYEIRTELRDTAKAVLDAALATQVPFLSHVSLISLPFLSDISVNSF
jgi:hypothetical protein